LGQSRKETQKPTASIVNPKLETRIGNWNVRTMFETGNAGQVAREMERYRLDILGSSECRWRGSGKLKLNTGQALIYSGDEEIHQGGVAIMMSQQAAKCLMEWTPESSRIIRARFYSEFDIGPFRPTEVKSAIKATKNGKAAGLDNVVAELLKTDLDERTQELIKLFNKVKEEGVTPKSWNRGLMVKLPKKGDLRECTNWRGITLLPVISLNSYKSFEMY